MFVAKTSRASIWRLLDLLLATFGQHHVVFLSRCIYIFHDWSDLLALGEIKLFTNLNSIRVLTDSPKILKIIIKTFWAPIETCAPFNWFSSPEESRFCLKETYLHFNCASYCYFFYNFDTYLSTGRAKSSN